MKLKFSQKLSAVFRRKYIKIELKFAKPYLLCVCCVFYRFFELLEAVLGGRFGRLFSIEFQLHTNSHITLWLHVDTPKGPTNFQFDYIGFREGFLFASNHDPNGLNWAETIFRICSI